MKSAIFTITATRDGVTKQFSEAIWNAMPAHKYGWVRDAETPVSGQTAPTVEELAEAAEEARREAASFWGTVLPKPDEPPTETIAADLSEELAEAAEEAPAGGRRQKKKEY